MFRICKSFEIESGHMLFKHPDKCRYPHGHTRRVEFVLEAEELDENEMVCDFKVLKIVGKFLESFDHAMCVNVHDPMYKPLKEAYGEKVITFVEDPTSEVMAQKFYNMFLAVMGEYIGPYPLRPDLVRLVSVRVWETSSSWAEYGE